MQQETRNCQNCKQDFVIEPDDFNFYEKMKVPAPTFCPDCRMMRRLTFRNERTMYKRKCDAPEHSEEMISIFSPDKEDVIYDQAAWWSDIWNPIDYGRDYNFSKSFFSQLRELWKQVPDIALINYNCVNSEYCSITEGNKDCYLVVGGDFNENSLYSSFIFHCKETMDSHWVSKSELNYETVDCIKCTRLLWSRYCEDCYNSAFLLNCRNCHDCFGCNNLVSKSYYFFNEQLSKDSYQKKMGEMNLKSWAFVSAMKERAAKESLKYPRRYARILRSSNVNGDNVENSKNCKHAFEVFEGAEDSSYLWLIYSSVKDCFDIDHAGLNSELSIDCSTIYPASRVFYSRILRSCHDVFYSYNLHNSSYCFGCVGLRDKQYCILNKQYSEKEYNEFVSKIIKHMDDMPYKDMRGNIYKFGEFFPDEISPFCYNETVAQELFPMSREKAITLGYHWKDPEKREYKPTISADNIPDSIDDVKDSITNEVIECAHKGVCSEQCSSAFKVTSTELEFYRRMGIPVPHLCPNCRHYQRLRQRNPLKLWHRQCMKEGCTNEFETSYSPDRLEIVYCEQCYQQEVA